MALTLADRTQVRPLNGAIVRSFRSGAAVQLGEVVTIDANNEIVPARAASGYETWGRGIVVSIPGVTPGSSAPADTDGIGVCVHGPVAGWSDMDEKLSIWVSSATAGVLTQTQPSGAGTYSALVGRPLATDIIFVDPASAEPTSNS